MTWYLDGNTMSPDRQKYFIDYCNWLLDSNSPADTVKSKLRVVADFCEKAKTINYSGHLHYFREHAADMSRIGIDRARTYVAEFLSVCGKGCRGRQQNRMDPGVELQETSIDVHPISPENQKKINDFLLYLTSDRDYSDNTIDIYTTTMKLFFRHYDIFDNDNARQFIAKLQSDGMSPSTIRLRITSLERFGKFSKKPVVLKRPKMPRTLHTENVFSEKEYQNLIEHARNKDYLYYLYFRALAVSGCRISELQQMTFEEIVTGSVLIHGKGNKYREILFPKPFCEEVSRYMKHADASGHFLCRADGQPLSDRGFNFRLKQVGQEVGIAQDKLHAHAFRHFFAKQFLKKNKDLPLLADVLGHRSIDTTRIYLMKTKNEKQREFNKSVQW